ncbi:MAG: hypothetical protein AAF214_09880, partial [Pseudomonadota bacterium]
MTVWSLIVTALFGYLFPKTNGHPGHTPTETLRRNRMKLTATKTPLLIAAMATAITLTSFAPVSA